MSSKVNEESLFLKIFRRTNGTRSGELISWISMKFSFFICS